MVNYKLLIMDIDDTLVHNAGRISKKNMDAIESAIKDGLKVVLATGRSFFGTKPVLEQLKLDTFIINYGGALITDLKTGLPLFTAELDNDCIQDILRMAGELRLHAHIYKDDCVIYEKEHPYVKAYVDLLKLPHRLEPDIRRVNWTGIPKALIITEPERVKELSTMFRNHFGDGLHVSESSPGFIEFNKTKVNKGTAAAFVADKLGIDRSETVAVGDNTLDYEMIEWAGLGAVVENGNAKLKSIANVITPSCADDGVAWLIDKYILNK